MAVPDVSVAVGATSPRVWRRVGSLVGVSASVSSVVRSAVHEAAHHLRLAGDHLAAAPVSRADDD